MELIRLGKRNEAQYNQLVQEQRDIFLKNAALDRLPEIWIGSDRHTNMHTRLTQNKHAKQENLIFYIP
jgi:hypothetical protein